MTPQVATSIPKKPLVWLLWSNRLGDIKQLQALATALGWPTVEIKLRFGYLNIPALGRFFSTPSVATLLQQPWPDIILSNEAPCDAVAQELRRRSSGRIKVVAVGRPLGHARNVDLVLTTAQFRLPPADNVVELLLPPGSQQPLRTTSHIATPKTLLLLVGASSGRDLLDTAAATRMMADVQGSAARAGQILHVTCGPRTAPDVTAVLAGHITPPNQFHPYERGGSRYQDLLSEADELMVTSDSVSMVADAIATGRPVSIYALPQKPTLTWHLTEWLRCQPLANSLFDHGIIEVIADRRLLFERLEREGLLSNTDSKPDDRKSFDPTRDMALAVAAVKALIGR